MTSIDKPGQKSCEGESINLAKFIFRIVINLRTVQKDPKIDFCLIADWAGAFRNILI